MVGPFRLSELRKEGWRAVPTAPGVYWWFFPIASLQHFKIDDLCPIDHLNLRVAPDDKVCLYLGLASSLVERIKWHAAQKLTINNLRSGYLSTFRLTLLALNGFDYSRGAESIDTFFDTLSVSWQTTETRQAAEELEKAELDGAYRYPLNIAGNSCAELRGYLGHLKLARSGYKRFHLSKGPQHVV